MKLETATIRRLRDALLQSGRRQGNVLSSAYETLAREGLLDDEEQAAIQRVEPLAETMFLMMAADGEVASVERDAIRGAIRGLADEKIHAGTVTVMLETFQKRLDDQGRESRLQELAGQLASEASEAEGAFALAAAVALADDRVTNEEEEFIQQLAGWFRISDERAAIILDQLEEDQNAASRATRS